MKKFILGLATAIIAIPVAESFAEYLCTCVEALKMRPTEKVIKGNAELQKYQNAGVELAPCIGFAAPSEEEYYEEEEEACKKKNKIGF